MRFFCAILAIGLLTAFRVNADPELADAMKAVVHDSPVTYLQVDDAVSQLVDDMRRRYADDPVEFQKQRAKLIQENTDRLIENELILHEYETAGYSLPESVIDDYVQSRIRARYRDRATMTRSLQAEGKTYERYRKQERDRLIIAQMQYKNVGDAAMISPHKIEQYYVDHTNDFRIEDQVKLRLIVLNKPADDNGQTRKLAEEILGKINEGASFAEMATVNSQDSHAKDGGAWDWFETKKLLKELADAAEPLKPGEKSGVIEVPQACYLLMVDDKRPAHIRPLSEVRDEIERTLSDQEQARLRQQWIDKLKKKTFVRYFY
jgi:parvulin-like peptidyl-prolyl isomerase